MALEEELIRNFKTEFGLLRAEVSKVIVGNDAIVDGVLTALIAGGHVLLEGVPGLGKTLLVRTLAQAVDLKFSRVQFTPDLMPADITGTTMLIEGGASGGRSLQFQPGPIFANLVLADEVNRATPKTQSALLEAMQEHGVTVGGVRHELASPFFVIATQNPIEMEGTYPLPEAQLDRFLFKLLVTSPTLAELNAIIDRTTGLDAPPPERVLDAPRILALRSVSRETPIAPHVREFAARVVLMTHPTTPGAPEIVSKYVRFGASPRGAQGLVLAAKVKSLLDGRYNVAFDDIRQVAFDTLRHRIILNFEGEAEGITADRVIDRAIQKAAADMAVRAPG
ncbi:MAG: AAA family ATPase [Capsulimonadaceae bacterium]|nr:AAA family ATPase [Capsulimonadaceae bacterium]